MWYLTWTKLFYFNKYELVANANHFLNGHNYPHQNLQVSGMLTLTQIP